MKWKDNSSFSRGTHDRTPKTWVAQIGDFCITVTRHIHHPPNVWVLNCDPFFAQHELNNKDVDEAKKEAIELVRKVLSEIIAEL